MRRLKKLRGLHGSSPDIEIPFNLHSRQHQAELGRLLEFSNTPQVSIHFEILGEEPQTATIRHSQAQLPAATPKPPASLSTEISSEPQAPLGSQILSTSQTSFESAVDESGSSIETIYAIASYTKILINVAYTRLICDEQYKHLGLWWEKSACDTFNEARERNGKSTILRTWGNPNIRQLLLHENGFAQMNRYLMAPDGTFIMSIDEFLMLAPLITEDCYKKKYPHRGWVQYSNANHIFAGIILEEITGRSLQNLMQELVFDWLDMTHTFLDELSLTRPMTGTTVATGYRVSATRSQPNTVPHRYMSDIVEIASLGARSTAEDLAKLNRAFLKGAEGELDSKFCAAEIADFFRPDCLLREGEAMTLGGLFGTLDSYTPGAESLSRVISPTNESLTYTLGRRRDGSHCNVYYKAGCIDGFSSSVYLLLKDRAFIVVLGNSSGPVDIADHTARYVLQEAFQLTPRTDVVKLALEEGRRCSDQLQNYEREDMATSKLPDYFEDLAGTYQHVRYPQQLTITRDGAVTIHGTKKTSTPMKLARMSSRIVRILPGMGGFGIERWSVWKDLEFSVDIEPGGRIYLLGNNGSDRYLRTS